MYDLGLSAMDFGVEAGLGTDALDRQRALLLVIIRRLDYVRSDISLPRSSSEWRGLAKHVFDEAIFDLGEQLERACFVLERAYRETVHALDSLAGRVR